MEKWIAATIANANGEIEYHQFDNEEELRYFLACNEDYKLVRAVVKED